MNFSLAFPEPRPEPPEIRRLPEHPPRAETDMPASASLEERPPLVIPTTDLLNALRPGDVITHAFRGASGVLGRDAVVPEFRDAVARAVRIVLEAGRPALVDVVCQHR